PVRRRPTGAASVRLESNSGTGPRGGEGLLTAVATDHGARHLAVMARRCLEAVERAAAVRNREPEGTAGQSHVAHHCRPVSPGRSRFQLLVLLLQLELERIAAAGRLDPPGSAH